VDSADLPWQHSAEFNQRETELVRNFALQRNIIKASKRRKTTALFCVRLKLMLGNEKFPKLDLELKPIAFLPLILY